MRTYKTIQSAVNAAAAGDIILVQSGTYNENVIVDKAITIKAAPGATPIVDAGQQGPGVPGDVRPRPSMASPSATAGNSNSGIYGDRQRRHHRQ